MRIKLPRQGKSTRGGVTWRFESVGPKGRFGLPTRWWLTRFMRIKLQRTGYGVDGVGPLHRAG